MKTKRIAIAALAAMMVASVGIAPAVSAKCTDAPVRVKVTGATIKTEKPELKGYLFAGWYTDAALEKPLSTATLKLYDGKQIYLYPSWTPIQYTIKLMVNAPAGATVTKGSDKKITATYDEWVKIKKSVYKVKGYKLTGFEYKKGEKTYKAAKWEHHDGGLKGYKVMNLRSHEGDTIKLKAQWKLESYSVTYKLCGGKNDDKNPESYTVKSKAKTLKAAKKNGYTFIGWYTKSGKKVTKIGGNGETGDKTVYAVYKSKVNGKLVSAMPEANLPC